MEHIPERKSFSERAAEIGIELGDGNRMSVGEKIAYLKEHGDALRLNADFVPVATYRDLFASLDLQGKTLINVGAGPAIGDAYRGVSPMIEALDSLNENVLCIPIDYNHTRAKSWDLLDSNDPTKDGPVSLAPLVADATALPFADGSIDGYLSANLINEPRRNELESTFVQRVLGEAYRVIKPGGFIVLSSFGYFWWEKEDGTIVFNDAIDTEEIVTATQVKRYLKDAGFTKVRRIPLDQAEILKCVTERKERKKGAIDAGVREACAFEARK